MIYKKINNYLYYVLFQIVKNYLNCLGFIKFSEKIFKLGTPRTSLSNKGSIVMWNSS